MFTSKPPKKPILKHPKSQMSLSTKKVSFENNKSYESSPGLQKSKALRNNIYKNFLQEQESFENLRNLASLRRVQSTGATIGDSERDEHLSDIDLTQARITDVDAAPEEIEELPHEDKENHSELANSKLEYPGTMDYLEVQKSGLPPQESMNLSNSSRVSVPHLEEQNQRQEGSRLWASLAHLSPSKNPSHQKYKSVSDVANEAVKQSMLSQFGKMKCEEEQNQHQEERIPSLNQTPNKPDYSILSQEEIKEQGGPEIQVTTPHGSKKRMENSGSAEGSRLWASLTHLSPSKNPSHQKYKSVTDVANEAVKQSMLSQFGKKKYEEEHGQMSARFEESLKASNDQVQIERPNMDPLMATGEKLNSFSHRSFKEEEDIQNNPLEQGENYMSLVDQSLEHHHDQNPAEEVSEKKKSRLAYLIGQEETPWSMVLDRSLRKPEFGQDSNIPKSLSMVPNDNLDLDLERLKDLRFRYEGKPGVEKVLDISKLLAMRSSLQDENQEENERLRKEEEEKQIRREAGAYKFGSAMEKIVATRNEEDMQDGFECIREEYYEQLEMIRLGKISRGFDKLDEGVLNDRTFMSIGMEELKEHLNQCLINQHAQDFREKMLAYNSLMALKEYALHVKRKLAKEAQAKQHYRYNKLRKNFDSIQQHAAFCKEWLENVKGELRLLKKSKIFDAWKADARYQKINRLTDQLIEKKQMKLKKRMVDFWKDETIQMYRLPLQEGVRRHKFRLVKRAYKVLKAYAIKKNISKENNMKAYLFMMDKLTRKGFNGLVPFYMKEQTRKLNVDDYEDFIPLRICIKDKVTKISSEDKDWALLNNERCVMIDVVKKKDK